MLGDPLPLGVPTDEGPGDLAEVGAHPLAREVRPLLLRQPGQRLLQSCIDVKRPSRDDARAPDSHAAEVERANDPPAGRQPLSDLVDDCPEGHLGVIGLKRADHPAQRGGGPPEVTVTLGVARADQGEPVRAAAPVQLGTE